MICFLLGRHFPRVIIDHACHRSMYRHTVCRLCKRTLWREGRGMCIHARKMDDKR